MSNIDKKTVKSFGDEWTRFDQRGMPESEAKTRFEEYFAVFPWDNLPINAEGFDMGCGTGRWARWVAPKVGKLHCIDPSAQALDVARSNLAKYDNVVFHRVIDGFMAQTGDVQFGNSSDSNFNLQRAGMGGSDLPDLKAEFNNIPHERGTLSMARSSDPNSANSQFFICFKPAPFLDNQYTVFGKVIEGMEFVDKIKRGDENNNGAVTDPDKIISFKSL